MHAMEILIYWLCLALQALASAQLSMGNSGGAVLLSLGCACPEAPPD